MLLAEELLLLLTDDDTGKTQVSGTQLDLALGGAQLVELSLAGRVDIDDRKRLVVRDASPSGNALLDRAIDVAQRREGKKPSAVIGELGKKLRPALYERLAAVGILRQEEGRVLGIFPTTRWPTASADHEAALRRRLVEALVQSLPPQPRDAALVALLHALRATHRVVPPKAHDIGRRELDRRAKEIAEGNWGSAAVRQAIDAATAAVLAATMVATTAATTSGSS